MDISSMIEALDGGILTGGLGFFFGAAITGLVTWYTVSQQAKHDAKMRELQYEHNFKMSALQYRREGFNKLAEIFFPLKLLVVKDLATLLLESDWKDKFPTILERIIVYPEQMHAVTISYFPDYKDKVKEVAGNMSDAAAEIAELFQGIDMNIEKSLLINNEQFLKLAISVSILHELLDEIGKTCNSIIPVSSQKKPLR